MYNFRTPATQDLIWVGEYYDGTLVPEYDVKAGTSNDFRTLQREKLIRFGLSGLGSVFYLEVFGGVFKLGGKMYEFVFKTKDQEYFLTGQNVMYKDIITYKDAESVFSLTGKGRSGIYQYNFGYKVGLEVFDTRFQFKPIVHIPDGEPAYFSVNLVSSKNLKGSLLIRKNNVVIEDIPASLKKGVGGEFNWIIR